MEIENHDIPAIDAVQPVERAEPPQIKGPVEVRERKKGEEVQVNRPDAGKQLEQVPKSYYALMNCVRLVRSY